ncbi:MAG: hypothetical protein JW958_05670 [Candidatus Eisenbacteria bacterium]|nr:hypothetical protein [Candidatus Eisenbacteria bacterium]
MRLLLIGSLVLALAGFAWAGTSCYGWEDGTGTIFGFYGNLYNPTNVSDFAHTGSHSLYMQESPLGGTPQAYVAWINGLTDGDVVDVSFYAYDNTEGVSPSARIWAHYTSDPMDPDSYAGSAYGLYDYSAGLGWDLLSYSWTFDSDGGSRDGLMIEFRLYSVAEFDEYWCDDICVTAPDGAIISFPGGTSAVDNTSWGSVKSLFR